MKITPSHHLETLVFQFFISAALLGAAPVQELEHSWSADIQEYRFDSSGLDRWNYPFNPTPGSRPKASVFRAEEADVGLIRHGNFVLGFDTRPALPASLPPESYQLQSLLVQVMTTTQFEVPYDPTFDSVFSYLPDLSPQREADEDAGRPIELFGAGFRNGFGPLTWTEATAYSPSPSDKPTVYPILPGPDGARLDASLGANYHQVENLPPMALGTLANGVPGALIPENTWIQFQVDLSHPFHRRYIQESLAQGRLWFTITSLNGGGQGVRTFPEFHTSDTLSGEAPRLILRVAIRTPASHVPITLHRFEQRWAIRVTAESINRFAPEWSDDLKIWTRMESPAWAPLENNTYRWVDAQQENPQRFYRVIQLPLDP